MGDVVTTRTTEANNSWTSAVFRQAVRLNYVHVAYTSSADAGNRWIELAILDQDGNTLLDTHSGAVQPASKEYHHEFFPGIYRETSYINDKSIQVPIPSGCVIPANARLQIADGTGVTANDSMVIVYQTETV